MFGLEIQSTVDPLDGEVCSGGWRFLWVSSQNHRAGNDPKGYSALATA
jgi:hypothetical protein